jgi:hypothetical protein
MGGAASGTATNLNLELTQAAQDAKFGMAGLANQIPLIAEQFGRLRQESGSTTGAFTALFSALKGPTGIIAAFTLLLTFKDEIVSFFTDTEQSAESLDKQLRETSDVLETIGGDLGGVETDLESLKDTLKSINDGLLGGGFGDAIDTILSTDERRFSQFQAAEALQNALQGSSDDAQQLRQVLRAAGVDVETILTANLRESEQALGQVRSEIEANADALRSIQSDPAAALADTEEATADAIQERFGQVSEALSAEVELGFKTGRERAEKQLEFLQDALQAVIRDEELNRKAQAFDPIIRKVEQLRLKIARLNFASNFSVGNVREPRTDAPEAAPPESPESGVDSGDIDTLTSTGGATGAGSVEEKSDQAQSEFSKAIEGGFQSGLQQGFTQSFQPLLNQIENDFARALTSAILQAAASQAAKKLTNSLFSAGSAGEGGGGAAGAAGGLSSLLGSAGGPAAGIFGALIAGKALFGIGKGIGLFAEGGRPPVGQPSIVGERGPELFVPDQAGTIIPNDGLTRPATRPNRDEELVREVRRMRNEMDQRIEITTGRRTKREFVEEGVEQIQQKRQSGRRR